MTGENQKYPQHKQSVRKVTSEAGTRLPLPQLPCTHATPLTGAERERLGLSHLKTWNHCSNPSLPLGKDVVCPCQGCGSKCKGYSSGEQSEFGVVIGSFGWAPLVDLQCRVIRETCGAVPILVSNDKPEAHNELAAICSRFSDVKLDTNPQRIGHLGGDLAAFHKGIKWGAARGLSVVCKLSQRFFVTKPQWLQDGAGELLLSGLSTSSQKCTGVSKYPIRSEAVLLDVTQWNRPEVLDRIKPREYWVGDTKGVPAETILFRVIEDLLGGLYWPWKLFGEDRYVKYPDTVWHYSHHTSDYLKLAHKFGVTLPEDFHTRGWERELMAGVYKHG